MRFDGKTALITGGTSGLGLATAEGILKEGGRVVVAGRDDSRGAAALERLREHGGADYVQVDLKDQGSLETAVGTAKDHLGGKIDIVVSAAGELYFAPVSAPNYDDALNMVKTNFLAPHLLIGMISPEMVDRGWGRFVNVTTMGTHKGIPNIGVYSATKAALYSYTQTSAVELAEHGVNVNAVAPGPVPTPMGETFKAGQDALAAALPAKRKGTEEEIAAGILFLVSDDASYVHGVTLFVDGGWAAS
jgi:NAD(P)-dependent dehydrogenase (short-subunit alcohol dehydrogenase family)